MQVVAEEGCFKIFIIFQVGIEKFFVFLKLFFDFLKSRYESVVKSNEVQLIATIFEDEKSVYTQTIFRVLHRQCDRPIPYSFAYFQFFYIFVQIYSKTLTQNINIFGSGKLSKDLGSLVDKLYL